MKLKITLQIKSEAATLDVLDSILESISGSSDTGIKNHNLMKNLPGYRVKEGKPSFLLQQIETLSVTAHFLIRADRHFTLAITCSEQAEMCDLFGA